MLFGSNTALETSPFSYYSPVLCISMHENAYLMDFGIDKAAYLKAIWKCINWSRVAILLNIN
jgi:superoxide dismutase